MWNSSKPSSAIAICRCIADGLYPLPWNSCDLDRATCNILVRLGSFPPMSLERMVSESHRDTGVVGLGCDRWRTYYTVGFWWHWLSALAKDLLQWRRACTDAERNGVSICLRSLLRRIVSQPTIVIDFGRRIRGDQAQRLTALAALDSVAIFVKCMLRNDNLLFPS